MNPPLPSSPWGAPIYVTALGVVSGHGVGWRGLADVVRRGVALGSEIAPLPAEREPCQPRHRKLMSRGAYLAAAAIKAALEDSRDDQDRADPDRDTSTWGLFMGVGASGGDMGELEAMLAASVSDRRFSLDAFGTAGLAAANPLFAFQLMNNFTLCHGAIAAGLQGPNAAFFSRGAGTVTAIAEAAHAVASREAPAALAGGADSALHPVTRAELERGAFVAGGLVPAEAAALLVLGQTPDPGRPRLVRAEVHIARAGSDGALTAAAISVLRLPPRAARRAVILCPWGEAARAALLDAVRGAELDAQILDVGRVFGDALAAAPALGCAVACDWLAARDEGQAIVLGAGIDGDLGVVELVREPR